MRYIFISEIKVVIHAFTFHPGCCVCSLLCFLLTPAAVRSFGADCSPTNPGICLVFLASNQDAQVSLLSAADRKQRWETGRRWIRSVSQSQWFSPGITWWYPPTFPNSPQAAVIHAWCVLHLWVTSLFVCVFRVHSGCFMAAKERNELGRQLILLYLAHNSPSEPFSICPDAQTKLRNPSLGVYKKWNVSAVNLAYYSGGLMPLEKIIFLSLGYFYLFIFFNQHMKPQRSRVSIGL